MDINQVIDTLLIGQSLPQSSVSLKLAALLGEILAQYNLVLVCKNGVIFARSEVLN